MDNLQPIEDDLVLGDVCACLHKRRDDPGAFYQDWLQYRGQSELDQKPFVPHLGNNLLGSHLRQVYQQVSMENFCAAKSMENIKII